MQLMPLQKEYLQHQGRHVWSTKLRPLTPYILKDDKCLPSHFWGLQSNNVQHTSKLRAKNVKLPEL